MTLLIDEQYCDVKKFCYHVMDPKSWSNDAAKGNLPHQLNRPANDEGKLNSWFVARMKVSNSQILLTI